MVSPGGGHSNPEEYIAPRRAVGPFGGKKVGVFVSADKIKCVDV